MRGGDFHLRGVLPPAGDGGNRAAMLLAALLALARLPVLCRGCLGISRRRRRGRVLLRVSGALGRALLRVGGRVRLAAAVVVQVPHLHRVAAQSACPTAEHMNEANSRVLSLLCWRLRHHIHRTVLFKD